jgi:hypothetical protein
VVNLEDKFTFSNSFSSSLNPRMLHIKVKTTLERDFVYILSPSPLLQRLYINFYNFLNIHLHLHNEQHYS